MTRPWSHKPTVEGRKQVRIMAGLGVNQQDICSIMEIGKPTLQKYYRKELDVGIAEANRSVAQALYKKAIGNGPQNVTAAIFWMKCRCGWRDVNFHEHVGVDGGGTAETAEARARLAALVARHRRILGPAEPVQATNGAEGVKVSRR